MIRNYIDELTLEYEHRNVNVYEKIKTELKNSNFKILKKTYIDFVREVRIKYNRVRFYNLESLYLYRSQSEYLHIRNKRKENSCK